MEYHPCVTTIAMCNAVTKGAPGQQQFEKSRGWWLLWPRSTSVTYPLASQGHVKQQEEREKKSQTEMTTVEILHRRARDLVTPGFGREARTARQSRWGWSQQNVKSSFEKSDSVKNIQGMMMWKLINAAGPKNVSAVPMVGILAEFLSKSCEMQNEDSCDATSLVNQ